MQQFPYSSDSLCGGGARPCRHHPSGHNRGMCPFLRQSGASAAAENGQSDTIPSLRTSPPPTECAVQPPRPTPYTDVAFKVCTGNLCCKKRTSVMVYRGIRICIVQQGYVLLEQGLNVYILWQLNSQP